MNRIAWISISLLVLIGIGAIMPLFGKVHVGPHREATQAMIMALAGSLERYRVAFDCYPPGPASGTADDGTLFKYLNGETNRGIVANKGTPQERHYEPYLTLGKEYYKANNTGGLVIVDQWRMPIHYFNSKAFVENGGNPKYCYNPDGVDIYSTGPDKIKDPDLVEPGTAEVKSKNDMRLMDDITNF